MFTALLVAPLLALVGAFAGAADECANCKPVALCAEHLKQEAAAVAALATKLESEDPWARKEAVTQLAELDAFHPLAPTLDTAKRVARMLDDEKVLVRLEAAKALGHGMHPDVAVKALAAALETTRKELAKLPFGRGDWGPPPGGGGPGGGPGGGAGAGEGGEGGDGGVAPEGDGGTPQPDETGGQDDPKGGGGAPKGDPKPEPKKAPKDDPKGEPKGDPKGDARGGRAGGNAGASVDPKAVERRKAREELGALELELVRGLARLPDDRSVEALAALLPTISRWTPETLAATAQGLLDLGSRKAVEAVVQRLAAAPVGDKGNRWGGPDKTGAALRELLAAGAEKAGAAAPPEWSDVESPDWERWFTKNQKHFPAKLGKYGLDELRKRAE